MGVPLSEAADYPTKGIEVIVSWSAGGGQDTMTRLMTVRLAKHWGVPVSVVNKPGGMGIPGAVEVLQSKPDGYTVLSESNATSSLLDAWGKDVPFNIRDKTYLASGVGYVYFLCASTHTGWKNIADLEEAVNKDPSSIRWGWLGGTAGLDVITAMSRAALAKKTSVDKVKQIKMITYPGSGPIIPAQAGGHIELSAQPPSGCLSLTSAGKARLLAVGDVHRSPIFPDVPTAAEQGWPDVKSVMWIGFSGPKGLPPNVVQAWEKGIEAILKDPGLKADLEKLGAVALYKSSADLTKHVLNEAEEIKALPAFK